ncbi:hypothetical protein [Luteimicrobium sp. DT211]|uniref:hypothetical protein n=1 Tax=Luteimicrobium sp. DT211 TaxID=3393412 RepID=UPI003CF96ED3
MGEGLELVRLEAVEPNRRGHHPGVFGLANGLARAGFLTLEDQVWWRRNNDWCDAAYLDPSGVDPLVYDRDVNPGAKAWFRASATPLVAKAREYGALLDRYGVACAERHTRDPGRVVYEDDVQVVAVPRPVG